MVRLTGKVFNILVSVLSILYDDTEKVFITLLKEVVRFLVLFSNYMTGSFLTDTLDRVENGKVLSTN